MKNTSLFLTLFAALTALHAQADVLELKNGKVLSGSFVGGTAGTIRFQTAEGLQVIETSQALALTFAGGGAPAAAPAGTSAAPAPAATTPAAAPASVNVPAGTTLFVRMVDGASSKDHVGKRFTTTLETDLVINGVMVAKTGTKIYGKVAAAQKAGRFAKSSKLDLRLSELTVGGALVPIMTGPYAQKGANSMGKTAKGAAAGAAIGAISGDAGKGAAYGAAASGLKKGEAVVVPPGTLIEFQLEQPVTVNTAR